MRQWLDMHASERLPPLQGDVIIAFDNNQVIGKSYHARSISKAGAAVVTAVVAEH